jgi:uncharacterized MAPEG superfamily protein
MAIAWWCVLLTGVMPVMLAGLAKSGGGYDNSRPRDYVDGLAGFHRRAWGAQMNSFEAFPLFAAAVAAALIQGVPQGRVDTLALVFAGARIAYVAAYLGDRPTLRSLVWAVGFFACIGLLTTPIWGR